MNYSFSEFFYNSFEKFNKIEYKKAIKNVLSAFFMKNSLKCNYFSGFTLIVTFFLCFLNEENAFYLFNEFFENILPQNYFKVSENTKFPQYLSEISIIKELS